MKEIVGDIWSWVANCDCILIPVSGYVKKDGTLVMGTGVALQAKELFPNIDLVAGHLVKKNGNIPHIVHETSFGTSIVTFPVKPVGKRVTRVEELVSFKQHRYKEGDWVPGWCFKADLDIIKRSAEKVVELANKRNWKLIVMPKVGCGYGELDWETQVKPLLEAVLDDRFMVVHKEEVQDGNENGDLEIETQQNKSATNFASSGSNLYEPQLFRDLPLKYIFKQQKLFTD